MVNASDLVPTHSLLWISLHYNMSHGLNGFTMTSSVFHSKLKICRYLSCGNFPVGCCWWNVCKFLSDFRQVCVCGLLLPDAVFPLNYQPRRSPPTMFNYDSGFLVPIVTDESSCSLFTALRYACIHRTGIVAFSPRDDLWHRSWQLRWLQSPEITTVHLFCDNVNNI